MDHLLASWQRRPFPGSRGRIDSPWHAVVEWGFQGSIRLRHSKKVIVLELKLGPYKCFYFSAICISCVTLAESPNPSSCSEILQLQFGEASYPSSTTAKPSNVFTVAVSSSFFPGLVRREGEPTFCSAVVMLFRVPLAYLYTRALFLILNVAPNGCFGLKRVVHLAGQILFLLHPASPGYRIVLCFIIKRILLSTVLTPNISSIHLCHWKPSVCSGWPQTKAALWGWDCRQAEQIPFYKTGRGGFLLFFAKMAAASVDMIRRWHIMAPNLTGSLLSSLSGFTASFVHLLSLFYGVVPLCSYNFTFCLFDLLHRFFHSLNLDFPVLIVTLYSGSICWFTE